LKINRKGLYGLVICGGKSTRMGSDKSLMIYHEKPQREHVYEMLRNLCEEVFFSCNRDQISSFPASSPILPDLEPYENIGPMAALLTAFSTYPDQHFFVLGCDYPFITSQDLEEFSQSIETDEIAAAFYKKENLVYEPLIAWYSKRSFIQIQRMFDNKQYSLQYFLKENNAAKFESVRPENIRSVDTPEEHRIAKEAIARINLF